jgi:isopentenyl-diphosphate delta-isomerase
MFEGARGVMNETIILVDQKDSPIGYEEKIAAHQNGGRLHRAFSIFILNSKNELLLQQRSAEKPIFRKLWSNSCCSHPLKGEELEKATHRKLQQEFGFDASMEEVFSFTYEARDENSGLTEHEFDHVFIGKYDGTPKPNPSEIANWKWVSVADLKKDLSKNPARYTPWLKIALDKLVQEAKLA